MANGNGSGSSVQPISPWWEDKAVKMVLLFLVTLMVNAIGRKFEVSLNVEEIVALALSILGFIFGHKYKSGMLQKQVLVNEAQAAGATASASPQPTIDK